MKAVLLCGIWNKLRVCITNKNPNPNFTIMIPIYFSIIFKTSTCNPPLPYTINFPTNFPIHQFVFSIRPASRAERKDDAIPSSESRCQMVVKQNSNCSPGTSWSGGREGKGFYRHNLSPHFCAGGPRGNFLEKERVRVLS